MMPIDSNSPMNILCECVESVKKLGDYFQCSVCCKTMIDVHMNVQTMRRCCYDCCKEIKERSPDVSNDLSRKGDMGVFLRDEQFEELKNTVIDIVFKYSDTKAIVGTVCSVAESNQNREWATSPRTTVSIEKTESKKEKRKSINHESSIISTQLSPKVEQEEEDDDEEEVLLFQGNASKFFSEKISSPKVNDHLVSAPLGNYSDLSGANDDKEMNKIKKSYDLGEELPSFFEDWEPKANLSFSHEGNDLSRSQPHRPNNDDKESKKRLKFKKEELSKRNKGVKKKDNKRQKIHTQEFCTSVSSYPHRCREQGQFALVKSSVRIEQQNVFATTATTSKRASHSSEYSKAFSGRNQVPSSVEKSYRSNPESSVTTHTRNHFDETPKKNVYYANPIERNCPYRLESTKEVIRENISDTNLSLHFSNRNQTSSCNELHSRDDYDSTRGALPSHRAHKNNSEIKYTSGKYSHRQPLFDVDSEVDHHRRSSNIGTSSTTRTPCRSKPYERNGYGERKSTASTTSSRYHRPSRNHHRVDDSRQSSRDVMKAPFEEKFNMLRKYKQDHGHCNVPETYSPLGAWVVKFREDYRRMQTSSFEPPRKVQEQVQRLESIGFEWTDNRSRKNHHRAHARNDPDIVYIGY